MRNHRIARTLALTAMLFALHAGANGGGEGWEPAREGDGISVYARPVADSKYREVRGETTVEAELNQLMALLDDTQAIPDWMHNSKNPRLLQKVSLLERYQYVVNDFPWPASDRDMIVRNLIHQDVETRVTTVELLGVTMDELPDKARARAPEPGDYVRVTELEGFFELTPLDEGRTRVVYQLHMEPGDSLPANMVNSQLVDNPFETLENMREVVQREKYRCFKPF